ncbi:unnamed protein product [Amoebophrya sp. A120]|nr:unnamed protein product [Amoebophrya sp. A120]|eukprot:GSA120T00008726001.1
MGCGSSKGQNVAPELTMTQVEAFEQVSSDDSFTHIADPNSGGGGGNKSSARAHQQGPASSSIERIQKNIKSSSTTGRTKSGSKTNANSTLDPVDSEHSSDQLYQQEKRYGIGAGNNEEEVIDVVYSTEEEVQDVSEGRHHRELLGGGAAGLSSTSSSSAGSRVGSGTSTSSLKIGGGKKIKSNIVFSDTKKTAGNLMLQ